MVVTDYVRSWLLLIPTSPSIIVMVFNLYHLLSNRALLNALNNHVIILLLACGLIEVLTDIVWQIHFYRTGFVLLATPAFCLAWVYIGTVTLVAAYLLMAWASIERHILIFHPNLLATKTKRFMYHYLPLIICILWPVMFYFVVFFTLPCSVPLRNYKIYCSRYGCLLRISWAAWIDSIANYIMPSFVTVFFSAALFARVIYARYRIRGRIDWRNYKKMAFQLLPMSILYVVLNFPPMLLYAVYTSGITWIGSSSYYDDGFFFIYWVVLFTPFATVVSLPELKTKCKKLLFWRKPRAVHPEALAMTRRNVGQTVAVAAERAAPAAMKPVTTTLAAPKATVQAPPPLPTAVATGVSASEAMVTAAAAPSTAVAAAITEAMVPEGKTLAGTISTSMLPTTMGQGGMPAVDI